MENVGIKSIQSGKDVLQETPLFVSSKTKLKLAIEIRDTRNFNSGSFSSQHKIGYVPLFLSYSSGIFRNESPFFYLDRISNDGSMFASMDGDKVYYSPASGGGDAPPFRYATFIFFDPAI